MPNCDGESEYRSECEDPLAAKLQTLTLQLINTKTKKFELLFGEKRVINGLDEIL